MPGPKQLSFAVLGVLAITAEYATGMIRTSLTDVPRRSRLLAAKAVTVGAVAGAVGLGSLTAAFLAGRAIVGDRSIDFATAPVTEHLPLLLASGLSVPVVALVALGLGTILRSTAGAIGAVVGLLCVVPAVPRQMPDPWRDRVASVLLPNLTTELAGAANPTTAFHGALPPLGALAVLAAYVVITLGSATILINRRDA